MKQQAEIKDILSWFDLENYKYIQDLTVKHVMAEVYFRMGLNGGCIDRVTSADFPFWNHMDTMEDDYLMDGLKCNDRGILPLNYHFISSIINSGLKRNICTIENGRVFVDEEQAVKTVSGCEIDCYGVNEIPPESCDPNETFNMGLILDLGLDNMTDEEIINHIAYNLPKWRERLSAPEPTSEGASKRIGHSFIKKIHNYKIIPFLDLQAWAHINNVDITYDLYSRLLFPLGDGELKSDSNVRNTIKPFADSVFGIIYHKELDLFFAKNPGVEDMLFSDYLKLAENKS